MPEKPTIRRMSQKAWQNSVVKPPANRYHMISGDAAEIVAVICRLVPAVFSNQIKIKFFRKVLDVESKPALGFVRSNVAQIFPVILSSTIGVAKLFPFVCNESFVAVGAFHLDWFSVRNSLSWLRRISWGFAFLLPGKSTPAGWRRYCS